MDFYSLHGAKVRRKSVRHKAVGNGLAQGRRLKVRRKSVRHKAVGNGTA
jgi:hypothetical protein